MRILWLLFLELPGELLSGKFRFISSKADGGSSVEMPSSAGLSRFQRVCIILKITEDIEIQAGCSSCRCPVVFPTSLILLPWVLQSDGFHPVRHSPSDLSLFELDGPCSSLSVFFLESRYEQCTGRFIFLFSMDHFDFLTAEGC